jgi:hypothetical protein
MSSRAVLKSNGPIHVDSDRVRARPEGSLPVLISSLGAMSLRLMFILRG